MQEDADTTLSSDKGEKLHDTYIPEVSVIKCSGFYQRLRDLFSQRNTGWVLTAACCEMRRNEITRKGGWLDFL